MIRGWSLCYPMQAEPVSAQTPPPGHEPSDPKVKLIVGIALGLLAIGVLIHLSTGWLFYAFQGQQKYGPRQTGVGRATNWEPGLVKRFPEPRLDVRQATQLRALRQRERQELESYAWVNRTGGVVRIPIDRAMDLWLSRGVPVFSGKPSDLGKSSLELMRERARERGTNPPAAGGTKP